MDLDFWAKISEIGAFLIAGVLAVNKFWPNIMVRVAKWKYPILFLVIGLILAIIRHSVVASPPSGNWDLQSQTIVRDKSFRNEKVPLDGRDYIGCKFLNVTFEYEGLAPFSLEHSEIFGIYDISTTNHQMTGLLLLMKELRMVNTNTPFLFNSGPQ